MGAIPGLPSLLRASGAIAVVSLLATTPLAQADTSAKLKHASEHLTADLKEAVFAMQPLVERYGYTAVAGTVAAEGLGIPVPGQTTLMAAALEAARGHLSMIFVGTLALLAAVIGNSLGYLIGRKGGRPLLRKLGASEQREEKIAALFRRYGGGFILLARFLDGPRQLNGIVAGVLEMPWWIFTCFNVLGALLWVGIWGLGTYYASEHLGALHAMLQHINPWAIGIALAALLAVLVYCFVGRGQRAKQ